MRDLPIIFSAPMVRALLAGNKTQTRRVIEPYKPQPSAKSVPDDLIAGKTAVNGILAYSTSGFRPRYRVGDRLYARENFIATWGDRFGGRGLRVEHGEVKQKNGTVEAITPSNPIFVLYKANSDDVPHVRWRPSIHMPRWASRLTLVVTGVKVERLQDISPEDARDEGVERRSKLVRQMWLFGADQAGRDAIYLHACIWEYEKLWNEINGPDAWSSNPWVAAYTFTVHRCNISEMGKQP
ncbi:hypothetical protein [Microvirga brassicacearum]|uniref:Uncharacterized protein n=1 Tax=Microvirga brassicacearum TaxID=2580413 RepID=A0A5N3PH12_9HYPH|nr:hypothetical protein [Microvirga brassicacearum]KAB0269032.1 hypothetical protein FEZ63_02685 [Microvirga brassicacearum]